MKTFAIIKPDAIARGLVGEIITRLEQRGFTLGRMKHCCKTSPWCAAHYSQFDTRKEEDREIYGRLQRDMIYKPLIGIMLEGPEAIRVLRTLVGATDSLKAAPGTIRGDMGTHPIHLNLIHASASEEDVDREAELFFDNSTDWD